MGIGSQSTANPEYFALVNDYQITGKTENEGILLLRHIQTESLHLLRQFTSTSEHEFKYRLQFLSKRQSHFSACKYLLSLQKVIPYEEKQYCSIFYKIYALIEHSSRNLDDQINERNLQKKSFEEKEIWYLIANCVSALSQLQRGDIPHGALRSSKIAVCQDGEIKIGDPFLTGEESNYTAIFEDRSVQHVYLSPQLTYALLIEMNYPKYNTYKSDVWTFAMIVMEMGLRKYQDECYRDDYTRIHQETLNFNLMQMRSKYSEQLVSTLEYMLEIEEEHRPDWIQLQKQILLTTSKTSYSIEIRESLASESLIDNLKDSKCKQTTKFISEEKDKNDRLEDSTNIKSKQNHISSALRSTMYEELYTSVQPSNISKTRPFRNIFPLNFYESFTKPDENLVFAVPDSAEEGK